MDLPTTTETETPETVATTSVFSDLSVNRIARKSRESSLVGYGSVAVAEVVEVRFTIRKRKNGSGLCVNWPAHKSLSDKWYHDVRITTRELKEELEDQIFSAFEALPPTSEK